MATAYFDEDISFLLIHGPVRGRTLRTLPGSAAWVSAVQLVASVAALWLVPGHEGRSAAPVVLLAVSNVSRAVMCLRRRRPGPDRDFRDGRRCHRRRAW
jgi:hypothetical protein